MFVFDGKSNDDFNLFLGGNNQDIIDGSFPTKTASMTQISSIYPKTDIIGYTYDSTLIISFSVYKNPCIYSEQNELFFTEREIRSIRKWLESPKYEKELCVYNEDLDEDISYFGVFTTVQPIITMGKVYGFSLTFTTNSAYGYSQETVRTYNLPIEEVISFDVDNDDNYELNYPVIKLNMSSTASGMLELHDLNKDTKFKVNIPQGYDYIIIDCERKLITSDKGVIPFNQLWNIDEIGIDAYLTIQFPALVDGENRFKINSSNIKSMEISTREIRRVGGLNV